MGPLLEWANAAIPADENIKCHLSGSGLCWIGFIQLSVKATIFLEFINA